MEAENLNRLIEEGSREELIECIKKQQEAINNLRTKNNGLLERLGNVCSSGRKATRQLKQRLHREKQRQRFYRNNG